MFRLRRAVLTLSVLLVLLAIPWSARAEALDPDWVRAIEGRVSSLRRLDPGDGARVVLWSRPALLSYLRAAAERPEVIAEGETMQKLLRLLGWLGPDVNLVEAQVESLSSSILGVYQPEAVQVVLVSDGEVDALSKVVLAHELTHALQYRHFNLIVDGSGTARNSDRDLAIQALIEGDAVLTAQIYATLSLTEPEMRQVTGREPSAAEPPRPRALKADVPLFYRVGADFVQELLAMAGWDGVNGAYARLPSSTAQVLHPDKFLADEQPLDVSLGQAGTALGPAWRLLREDTLGELQLQETLLQQLPPFVALAASDGWRGDRYQLLERVDDGFLALVFRSVWASESDAGECLAAFAEAMPARYGSRASLQEQRPGRQVWTTPDGIVWLESRGDQVMVVMAPGVSEAQRLAGLAHGQ